MGVIKTRVGTMGVNNHGSEMILIDYIHANDVWVKFIKNGDKVHTSWRMFTLGKVKSVYDKRVCNIGYLGEGKYSAGENGKATKIYTTWQNMLKRCYDKKSYITDPTYRDCSVCEEWHNFQNFAKWYDENYYEIEGEIIHLDKDILKKGNKIYSSETCVFAPRIINNLFLKRNSKRGDLPIGVGWHKKRKIYESHCKNKYTKNHTIGYFKTPEEAFGAYKVHKEELIKQVAEEYKEKIPVKLYNAMINYIVEIDD